MSLHGNRSLLYCNTPQCKICRLNILDTDPDFYSNLPVKKYSFNGHGSCKSRNCIYLISCKHVGCQMKYVGFTTTPLNKRLCGHRANIINGTEGVVMLHHFTRIHTITDMIIKPLEFCDGKFLRAKEKYWMQELNTIFPYGLNSRIDISGIHDAFQHAKSISNIPIYSVFNTVKNNRTKRGSGNTAIPNEDVIPFNPADIISTIDNSNTPFIAKRCRQEVMALKIKVIYKLLLHITNLLSKFITIYKSNEYLLYVLRDLCLYRIHKSNPKIKTKHNNYIMVNYTNRLLDQVNIGKIIHSSQSCYLFPANKEYLLNTGVSFKYCNTIRSKVTNYKETVTNVNHNVQCACDNYQEFVDGHHGHVITGNLNFIKNEDIKKLFGKGLNFREKQPLNLKKVYENLQSAIDAYIYTASNSLKIPVKSFSPWKIFILNKANNILKDSHIHPVTTVLNKRVNIEYLNLLHSQFVIVPVDKASTNIGIICKWFYLHILSKEITESGNFESSNATVNDITGNYISILKSLGGDQHVYAKNIPFIYWIPKFHKDPVGFRYITSGRHTCINGLSKILGICLKRLLDAAKTHSNKIHKFDNVRDYVITDSNKNILQFMSASNLTTSFKDVKTYDFQTLYTKIPQDKLKENLQQFINYVFHFKESKYVNVRNNFAVFSDTKSKTYSFTQNELITYLNYGIDNAFISFNKQVCRQSIGIPMGRNDASHLANIFLHMYEKSFYQHLIDNNRHDIIANCGNLYRFQDDLITFGMQPQRNICIQKIYPKEMVIKNTNVSPTKVTYLDVEINVNDNKYIYKSYDKRLYFNFPIIRYPNLEGNIPVNPAYGVFISQLIRFCAINMLLEDFKHDVIELVRILLRQGYKYKMLKIKFKQFARDNVVRWAHFGTNFLDIDFIDSIITKTT